MGVPGGPHLLRDERTREGDGRPEEDAAAQDHLSIEAVTQIAEDGGSHHEAADEHCGKKREAGVCAVLAEATSSETQLSLDPEGGSGPGGTASVRGTQSRQGERVGLGDMGTPTLLSPPAYSMSCEPWNTPSEC